MSSNDTTMSNQEDVPPQQITIPERKIPLAVDIEYLQQIILKIFVPPNQGQPATPSQVMLLAFQNQLYLGDLEHESKVGQAGVRILVNFDIDREYHQQILNTRVPLYAMIHPETNKHVVSVFEPAEHFSFQSDGDH